MTAAADDALVLDALQQQPTTPVAAAELSLRLRMNERRISSALGRLRRRNLVNRKTAVCPHCRGKSKLTTWTAARGAVGLVQRPSTDGATHG